jgi:5'-3' exonuclease
MNKSLILIDTSYTAFYRFFATLRWFSHANPDEYKQLKEDPKYNWCENKLFIEKYEKMFMKSIVDLVKKKVFNNSTVIFCMDSPKETLWRTKLDPNYKGERADMSLKHNFKPTFTYTYETIIPQFIKDNNIHGIRIESMEADDIIASICMYLKETNKDKQIYLVSGDEDFLQLGRPSIQFVNYKQKKPFTLTDQEARNALKKKLLMGDKSDGIMGIFPKGSRVKKQELIESDEKLQEYLANNNDAMKQYENNIKMIDFNSIPKKYYNKAVKLFISIN